MDNICPIRDTKLSGSMAPPINHMTRLRFGAGLPAANICPIRDIKLSTARTSNSRAGLKSGGIGRQFDCEGGANAGLTGDFDAAALGVHDGFADRQTEAAVSEGAGTRFIGAVKTLENVCQILRSDALSGVGNGANCGADFGAGANANFAAGLVVVDGVGKEVDDGLAEALGVPERFRRCEVTVNLDPALLGERTDAFDAGANGFRQVERRSVDGSLIGFQAGKFEQR